MRPISTVYLCAGSDYVAGTGVACRIPHSVVYILANIPAVFWRKWEQNTLCVAWKPAALLLPSLNGCFFFCVGNCEISYEMQQQQHEHHMNGKHSLYAHTHKKVLRIPIRYSHLHSINSLYLAAQAKETSENIQINLRNDFFLTSFMWIMQCNRKIVCVCVCVSLSKQKERWNVN